MAASAGEWGDSAEYATHGPRPGAVPSYHVISENQALMVHDDERTWFVDCSRLEAEALLRDRPIGTFLIRPRQQEGSYALSIVMSVHPLSNQFLSSFAATVSCNIV